MTIEKLEFLLKNLSENQQVSIRRVDDNFEVEIISERKNE
jgi:hypothetical protein